MAGKIIVDTLDTDNSFITLNVQQATVATMNANGIFSRTGTKMIGTDGSIGNSSISGATVSGNLNFDATGTTGIRSPAANTLSFHTTGTEDMRIDANGNMGIGETSPAGSAGYTQLVVRGTNGAELSLKGGATQYGYVYVDNGGFRIINPQSGSASGTLQFHTSNTERMRIDNSGRVGMGTTSPNTRLHIAGAGSGIFGVYDDVVKVKGASLGSYIHLEGTDSQSGVLLQANTDKGWFVGHDNSQGLKFSRLTSINQNGLTSAKDTGSPSMLLTAAGQVAMGDTSASAAKLHVNGNNSGSSFGLYVRNNQNGGAAMGINAENPTSTHIQFYNNDSVPTGYISKNGASAVQYITSSDYRLKENVAPMTGALSKVAQLKPCTYTWKLDGGLGEGFIAHELQEVVPRAVSGEKDAIDAEGNIKPQGIDASYLVATLTAAIQEQQAIISDLKARIEALEA